MLYNLGIEFNSLFLPSSENQTLFPARYAYFRNGNLYLLGVPILTHEDHSLTTFVEKEKKMETAFSHYRPFLDSGPPLTEDGKVNKAFIQQYGIQVPDKKYLVLGDNHAMSADSRDFGFVPVENIKGVPSYIFWPPGLRFGHPLQQFIPWISCPNLIVWCLAILIMGIYSVFFRRKYSLPLDIS